MTQNTNSTTAPVLVTGGTGKTGRRVAARLTALGREVRLGSRSSEIPFDWEDRSTWAAAIDGTSAIYLAYAPDAGFPGADEIIGSFASQAVAAGVTRIVLLTGRGEAGAEVTEKTVAAVPGIQLTIVRAAVFAQNFSEGFLVESVQAGVLAFPAGDVAEPFIDVDDIADVAVAALTDDKHIGELYELTGPRLVTFAEAAAEIGAVIGKHVEYVPLTPEQFRDGMVEHGVPAEFAAALAELMREIMDGHNAHVADGVRRALGREARDFSEYVRTADAVGAWG
ncbi:NmrA family NAD(P)-binding protein [Phytomonospora sp. NPDC050363]|uniref:NmrA family NAD(P)-binding protein n=1 Tax=Phytomonospora sp. NPDC050363 TaxID=3155642 RepID=UPI00340988E2